MHMKEHFVYKVTKISLLNCIVNRGSLTRQRAFVIRSLQPTTINSGCITYVQYAVHIIGWGSRGRRLL